MEKTGQDIINDLLAFLAKKDFPCVAAREAVARQNLSALVAGHMACPHDDAAILDFLYRFVDAYRSKEDIFHSAAIIFNQPQIPSETMFESLMWQRLQALSDMDAQRYGYDQRVDSDPSMDNFSFSLKEEAFFILGLHPHNSRPARRFPYAVLVFNPHAQFEQIRAAGRYNRIKNIVRKRDLAYSGSVNPMLKDFGNSSEVSQYSGRQYESDWRCPLNINHGTNEYNSAPERRGLPAEERTAS